MTPVDEETGVAVVGLGVGEEHARSYLATAHCELRWLYDLDQDKASALAAKFGVTGIARSFEDILHDPRTDLVSIASYDDVHFKQALASLNAGKHVFVEKPICRTHEELQAIKNAWAGQKGRLKLASNLVLRAAPIYQWLKKKIGEGDLGEIYAFDGDYLYGRLHKITEGWRKDVDDYSVMTGGGVHLIDLLVWLTGQLPASVFATGNRICTEQTQFRYDDYSAATFQFPSGLIGRITANFGCVHHHQHVLRVFGTKATFILDDMGPRIHRGRDGTPGTPVDLATRPKSKGDLIPAFVNAVRNGSNLDQETQTHFDVIRILAACDEALKTKSITEIQYV